MHDEQYQTNFCTYLILLFTVNLNIFCSACSNLTIVYLSDCYFNPLTYINRVESRIVNITVAHIMNPKEESDSYAVIRSNPPYYVRITLDVICSSMPLKLWSTLELSSTLNGEFVQTKLNNILLYKNHTKLPSLYLSSGTFYIRNLTINDCQTNIQYRTNLNEILQFNIRLESNFNDTCNIAQQNSCYPTQNYICDEYSGKCTCRSPLLLYQKWCTDFVNITNCTYYSQRCIKWCEMNDNIDCICPQPETVKKQIIINNNNNSFQTIYYCEILPRQSCQLFDTIRRCSLNQQCINGYCTAKSIVKSNSIISSIELLLIVLLVMFIFAILALIFLLVLINRYCRRKEKHISSSLVQYALCARRESQNLENCPQKIYSLPNDISRIVHNKMEANDSVYDNQQNIYGVFRNNVRITKLTQSPIPTENQSYLVGAFRLPDIWARDVWAQRHLGAMILGTSMTKANRSGAFVK
ncbi:unnamed protein product, partial [Didymodactylos carnosus]